MRIIQCEQRSEEWFALRLGVPSASSFDDIVTMKGERSKTAERYLFKLAGEKVSGKSEDAYQNAAMVRGIELEAEARELYEFRNECKVEQVGFCLHDDINAGCSPDGLVGDDGALEIKCPLVSTHVKYLLDNKLPSDYFQQVQGQLFITGRKWVDFMSYYPGLKPLIVRVTPDEAFQKALKDQLSLFCAELTEVINKIK